MSPVPKEDREKPVDDHPDSNNVENDENLPDFVISLTSSESDPESELDGEYAGYELLPQDPEILEAQHPRDISEDMEELPQTINSNDPVSSLSAGIDETGALPLSIPDPPKEDAASLLWNQIPLTAADNLDENQEEKVRDAMKGFQLPVGNIPEWALNIPEDKWKEHLLSKLHQLENKDTDHKSNSKNDSHPSSSLN
ncbi:male-enhanced antigen 1 [Octopus vulgaris]|nr:uncharacterized protein LOC115222646 isoform X1 [Octopus sinensis]CAI9734682.1 male-enhanced antigen 1 [Octopus vulgaris]